MRFTTNAKVLKNALEASVLKGKYFSSVGLKASGLSDFALIAAGENTIQIFNGNDATAVSITVEAEIESQGEVVIPIKKVSDYLKNMNDITVAAGDLFLITSEQHSAKIPVHDEHPAGAFISFFRAKCNNYTMEDDDVVYGRNDTPYNTILDVSCEDFSNAISMCEVTNSGIYCLDFNENLSVRSVNGNEEFNTILNVEVVKDEEATMDFTAPIHRLFSKEMIRICFNDNSPIFIIGENAKIMRAPYMNT